MKFLLFLTIVAFTAQTVLCRPQFLTFKDGTVGVNFGGYHAQAGLGGLLSGDSAHGGLHASAGTPFGQNAGAGLGGSVIGNGRTAGGLYAGATAGHGVGASAALGGSVDETGAYGGKGAESHVPGALTKTIELSQTVPQPAVQKVTVVESHPGYGGSLSAGATLNSRSNFATNHQVQTQVVQQEAIPTYQTVKTISKKKYITRPHKVVHIEKRINVPPPPVVSVQTYQQDYHQPAHHVDFDYRKFLDFGYFTNLAAGYGGTPVNHGAVAPTQTVVVQKTIAPAQTHTVHVEKNPVQVYPNVETHRKDSVEREENGYKFDSQLTVDVEKSIVTKPSVQLAEPHPLIYGLAPPPAAPSVYSSHTFPIATIQKEIHLNKRIGGDSSDAGHAGAVVASGNRGTFFDDIFNIPISTLTAVNRLLNNKAQGGTVGVHKTVSVHSS